VWQDLDEAANLWQLVIHPFGQEIQVWMKRQFATGEIFIYPGLFGRVWMKPKTCGNLSFIHSPKKYRFG
ncbi:MAG: hypothetical protein WCS21_04710, partial [Lachnospiraceae bacterium]